MICFLNFILVSEVSLLNITKVSRIKIETTHVLLILSSASLFQEGKILR